MKDKYIGQAMKDKSGKHWSRYFYDEAKKEGYEFAVRQHIPNFSDAEAGLYKLKTKEELEEIPFFKSFKNSEFYEGENLPKNHPESTKEIKFKDYAPDGEQLIVAHLKNGSNWVMGYFMDLTTYKI